MKIRVLWIVHALAVLLIGFFGYEVFRQLEMFREKARIGAEMAAKKGKEDRLAEVTKNMILIPAGEFMMGCNEAMDQQCDSDEYPYHRVNLDGYYIDKFDVTVAEYKKCVNAGKCETPNLKCHDHPCNWEYSNREDHPVNCVDWNQAKAYCASVGKRLPTEAEWEKAARGADGRIYSWGNKFDCRNSCNSVSPCSNNSTCPVGSYPEDKSPYGVMDMSGNIGQWVADRYSDKYYRNSPSRNPSGPSSGPEHFCLRGGSWFLDSPEYFRTSPRSWNGPNNSSEYDGFRCARDAEIKK